MYDTCDFFDSTNNYNEQYIKWLGNDEKITNIVSKTNSLIFSLKLTDVKTCHFNPLNYDDIEATRGKFIWYILKNILIKPNMWPEFQNEEPLQFY